MIRHAIFALFLAASFSTAGLAGEMRFPYEATVASDNVYVRSGPGRKYYPTNKLNREERVVVHRHDPGGWYMIEPPRGAFSWIREDYVKRSGKNRGTVTQNEVRVHVGSELGPDHDAYQQTLSINDTVEIIGEDTIQEPERSIRMLKIVPPRYEYRWISGKDIIPSDASVRREHDRDPYAVPSNAKHDDQRDSYAGIHDSDDDHRHPRGPRGKAVQERGPGIDVLAAEKEQLRRLDEEFRDVVRRETRHWHLAQLEDDYRDLYDAVERPAMKKQIAMRLDAIERYTRVKAEYDEFIELTSATNWRDQRLLSIDRRHAGRRGPVRTPLQSASAPTVGDAPPPRGDGIPSMPPISVPAPHPDRGPFVDPVSHEVQNDSPFDGAGVIQRATYSNRGTPQHVLLSPNGKILAYLQPEPGVNLDRHVGEQMGVRGKRWHRADLNSDFIVVKKLTPVRLIP